MVATTKFFLARGSCSVAEELSLDCLRLVVLHTVAGVYVAITTQLPSLSEFDIEVYFPRPLRGKTR